VAKELDRAAIGEVDYLAACKGHEAVAALTNTCHSDKVDQITVGRLRART
jgi:hypothetical protein